MMMYGDHDESHDDNHDDEYDQMGKKHCNAAFMINDIYDVYES